MDDFPLSTAFLEQFRLRARQRTRAGQVGAHLRRRQGQSLEFRDFTPYTPGDDVRYIDWRVSLRVGQRGDLLVRRFGAEEQLTLAVSVDNRPRMHLPEHAPKIVMAGWLARALGEVALRSGDRVVLHRLFGAGPPGVVELRQRRTLHAALNLLEALVRHPALDAAHPNLEVLYPKLPPAAVWVILSDLYFAATGDALARVLARAQDGLRWVILVDLDSWPYEKAALGLGARLIEGPGVAHPGQKVDVTPAHLAIVEERIHHHKASLLQRCRRGGLDYVHVHGHRSLPLQDTVRSLIRIIALHHHYRIVEMSKMYSVQMSSSQGFFYTAV